MSTVGVLAFFLVFDILGFGHHAIHSSTTGLFASLRVHEPADNDGQVSELSSHWSSQEIIDRNRRHLPGTCATKLMATMAVTGCTSFPYFSVASDVRTMRDRLSAVNDTSSYPALVYSPTDSKDKKVPLLVVLHGAGKNRDGVWSLAGPRGEHAGLLPSLISSNRAPFIATANFAIVAPYAEGKRSFYEEPRSKLLTFVDWVLSSSGQEAGCPENIDRNRVYLFGFSDGATVGVELATTRRFKAAVICAYGFSGILPDLALERLKGIPMWIFHSADDVIFPVAYSDQLVKSLREVNPPGLIRYTRFDKDQEGFEGDVRGHSTGITATKLPDIYTWMLSMP